MKTPIPIPSVDLGADAPIDDCLSAFLDGEADAGDSACTRWRDHAAARRTWHAYHLIGDVMRSEELATAPAADAAFLQSLRTRLAAEPVVLAPVALRRRSNWMLPAAAAAGMVVVAGVLVMMRSAAPGSPADGAADRASLQLAAEAPAPGLRASAVLASQLLPGQALSQQPASASPALIRDARLDEYLRAHQAAGGLAVATPGGWLRRVDAVVAQPSER